MSLLPAPHNRNSLDRDSTGIDQAWQPANLPAWPEPSTVGRLSLRKTPYYALGPILESEDTISGTYSVLDKI
jgi:hypothetical protein